MRAGVRQAFTTQKGQLHLANPQGLIPVGYNSDGDFMIDEKPVADYRDRHLPNMTNFNYRAVSKQPTMSMLAWFIFDYHRGCEAQITLEKETSGTTGGVYNFDGENHMGIDFEWRENSEERSCEFTLEVDLENEVAMQVIQSASVNTPRDLNALGLGHRGQSLSNYRAPFPGVNESPIGTPLCNNEEILSKEFRIKNITTKRYRNRSRTVWINFYIRLLLDRSANFQLIELFSKQRNAAVKLSERNTLSSSFTYTFNEGVLFRKNKLDLDKSKKEVEAVFEANVAIADITMPTGTNSLIISESV